MQNMRRECKEEWNRKSAEPTGKKTTTATPQRHCQYTERTYTRADVWGVKFEEVQGKARRNRNKKKEARRHKQNRQSSEWRMRKIREETEGTVHAMGDTGRHVDTCR